MPRPLKYLLYLVVLLIALVAAGAAALAVLFDPNDYKPQIAAQVKSASSLELRMPGSIGWKLFPRLSLSIGETELHTPKTYAGDTLFAKLEEFSLGVGWRSLLKGALRADQLSIDGLQLRMVTDKRGHSNWKDVEAAAPAQDEDDATSASDSELALELADLSLRNISVQMIDQQLGTTQAFELDQFLAQYVNLSGKSFPMQIDAVINDGQRSFAVDMQADALIDNANERYALQNMRGRFDKSQFDGQIKIGLGKQTTFNGDLNIDEINIDDYTSESEQAASANAESQSTASSEDISFDVLRSLNTRLKLKIGKLVASEAVFDDLTVDLAIANSILNLNNFRAGVFGGTIELLAKLDARGKQASLSVQPKMTQVEIAEVFENRDIAVNFSGKASINAALAMRGNSVDAWLASVSGNTEFLFDEGRYGDDNIQYRVCQAIALARAESLGAALDTGTAFDSVRTVIDWQNGVGRITQFTAGLDNLKLNGDGSISLQDQQFDLRVLANVTGDISGSYPACVINEKYRNIKWPLRCRGDANESNCGVDNSRLDKILAGLVKERAKQEVREKINEKIGGKIEEKLGKGVGEALKGLFK
ncbi:MAG: AsmA family protein [Gammaproteobacteria bacterium]|nr:AsmA family protein [Gammaproteobacteria bacterium]NND39956.1 AsmA family protein [Pseudomonadales bacterium]NNL12019.1 AsmA family protein [Pseudomonadales bacterium]NNM12481.1 AsmA family protein [Pseudomonadales bacterium]